MPVEAQNVVIRPLTELDIEAITRIDEKITGLYRPDFWESRIAYYLRRDPESSQIAEVGGVVAGFMMGDVRGGEFGLEETAGWIERFGIDPDYRGHGLGKKLFQALAEHFRSVGAVKLRTLADSGSSETAGFLKAMGFGPSPLEALEMSLLEGEAASGRGE